MLTALGNRWSKATFKREFAILSFFVWTAITWKVFTATDVALITAWNAAYGTASMSVWVYITGAFGMDFAAKQWNNPQVTMSSTVQSTAAINVTEQRTVQPKLSPGGGAVS